LTSYAMHAPTLYSHHASTLQHLWAAGTLDLSLRIALLHFYDNSHFVDWNV